MMRTLGKVLLETNDPNLVLFAQISVIISLVSGCGVRVHAKHYIWIVFLLLYRLNHRPVRVQKMTLNSTFTKMKHN